MNDLIEEPLGVLCDEVGVPMPVPDEHGVYRLVVDGQELRVLALKQGRIIVTGVLGHAETIAANRREEMQVMLASCMTLQAARLSKLGTGEVLTLESETGELVLWLSFEGPGVPISRFLPAAESLLNEMEFWKNWLAAS